jgi:hypothetical protein
MLPGRTAILRHHEQPEAKTERLMTGPSRFGQMRPVFLLVYLGLVGLFGGCTSMNSSLQSVFSGGCLSEAIEAHRNRTCALKAWFRREHNFCDEANLRDFRSGFIAGYVAIAEGKPGCAPNVPPNEYWGWAYQSADGQSRMAAWFRGYPYGVQAARDDGVTGWNHIQLGPDFQPKKGTASATTAPAGSPSIAPNPFAEPQMLNDQELMNEWMAPDASIMPLNETEIPGANSIFPDSDSPFPL